MIETCLKYFAIAIMAWQQTAVIDISKRPDGPANISFQSRTCSRAGRLARSELQCRFGIQHLHHTAQRQALRNSQQSLPHAIVSSSHNDLWLEIRVGGSWMVRDNLRQFRLSYCCLLMFSWSTAYTPPPFQNPCLTVMQFAHCQSMAMRWTTHAKLDILWHFHICPKT